MAIRNDNGYNTAKKNHKLHKYEKSSIYLPLKSTDGR